MQISPLDHDYADDAFDSIQKPPAITSTGKLKLTSYISSKDTVIYRTELYRFPIYFNDLPDLQDKIMKTVAPYLNSDVGLILPHPDKWEDDEFSDDLIHYRAMHNGTVYSIRVQMPIGRCIKKKTFTHYERTFSFLYADERLVFDTDSKRGFVLYDADMPMTNCDGLYLRIMDKASMLRRTFDAGLVDRNKHDIPAVKNKNVPNSDVAKIIRKSASTDAIPLVIVNSDMDSKAPFTFFILRSLATGMCIALTTGGCDPKPFRDQGVDFPSLNCGGLYVNGKYKEINPNRRSKEAATALLLRRLFRMSVTAYGSDAEKMSAVSEAAPKLKEEPVQEPVHELTIEEKTAALMKKIEAANANLKTLSADAEKKQIALDTLQSENRALKAESLKLQNTATQKLTEKDRLLAKNTELNKTVSSYESGAYGQNCEHTITALQNELTGIDAEIADASRKLAGIRRRLLLTPGAECTAGETLIKRGSEKDLYSNEIKDVVLECLHQNLASGTGASSRRNAVINSILKVNGYAHRNEDDRTALKEILSRVNSGTEFLNESAPIFNKLNIITRTAGRHRKIYFQNDDRYMVTMPLTTSDYRSFRNLASELCNTLI